MDAWVNTYAEKYNNIVQSSILEQGLFAGVLETLKKLKAAGNILFINSMTPTDVLQKTVASLGIAQFFEEMYGAPTNKADNLRAIMERTGITHEGLVFIGDGDSDREAAKIVGCPFVGILSTWNGWHNKPFSLIAGLTELPDVLLSIHPRSTS